MTCVLICHQRAHVAMDGIHSWIVARCKSCFACVSTCPNGALRQIGEEMTVRQVIEVVVRDLPYYRKSGGGITLSGGEPLAQPEFSLALLYEAKNCGIHTCVETSGFRAAALKKIADYVDLFLFDFKLSNSLEHEKHIGTSLEKVLESLAELEERKATVILRCPIIPGINDDLYHFEQIAGLSNRFSCIKGVEIMPYHDYGRAKAKEIGGVWALAQKSVDEERAERWIRQLAELGCRNVRRG